MKKKISFILFSAVVITLLVTGLSTVSAEENTCHNEINKDSIEWVASLKEPITREEKLESALTLELQRRTLLTLEERYIEGGKENVYSFEPFQVSDIRQDDGGFIEIDVVASFQKLINNEPDKNIRSFQITFKHDYNCGFLAIKSKEL
ncbi:hypothetical protein [Alkalihalobacillus sp. 1P02AB]|uniref:hypothetical protein n=1 Tax=Alkalihalobacillus sp. 1P02AB TaxID=3132260 RepID=UPI0039A6E080